MILKLLASFCITSSIVFLYAAGETGCPDEEDILPCTCVRRPTPRLFCTGLSNGEQLEKVFSNSERYSYQEVHVENSSLLYISGNIFQNVVVKELYLKNLFLGNIFSELPNENKDLYKLQIDNCRVMGSITSQNLQDFSRLTELSVLNSEISTFSNHYSENLPKSIRKIILHATRTKSVNKGALLEASNLDKLTVEYGKLKQLSRDIFPRPFNGRILNFNNNKITSIPDDLFTDMPNLQFLSMMNNALTQIPEKAFSGRVLNVPYFLFEGNPLQCDCEMLWIIKDKPEVLNGTCAYPDNLKGRQLQGLISAELNC